MNTYVLHCSDAELLVSDYHILEIKMRSGQGDNAGNWHNRLNEIFSETLDTNGALQIPNRKLEKAISPPLFRTCLGARCRL